MRNQLKYAIAQKKVKILTS